MTIGATGAAGGVSIQLGNPPAGTKFLYRGGICVVEGGVCTGVGLKLDGGLLLRGLSGTQSAYIWTTAP